MASAVEGLLNTDGQSAPGLKLLKGPELVFGLVGAIGTDLRQVAELLEDELKAFQYKSSVVRVSQLFKEFDEFKSFPQEPADERWNAHMNAGNSIRERLKRNDALALLAITKIRTIRRELQSTATAGDENSAANLPVKSHAYIIHQLKRPEEITTLRRIYGRAFWLISAYSSRQQRLDVLADLICTSHYSSDKNSFRSKAEELMQRDEEELGTASGQDVRDAFPMGDFFVRADSRQDILRGLRRFLDLVTRSRRQQKTSLGCFAHGRQLLDPQIFQGMLALQLRQ